MGGFIEGFIRGFVGLVECLRGELGEGVGYKNGLYFMGWCEFVVWVRVFKKVVFGIRVRGWIDK